MRVKSGPQSFTDSDNAQNPDDSISYSESPDYLEYIDDVDSTMWSDHSNYCGPTALAMMSSVLGRLIGYMRRLKNSQLVLLQRGAGSAFALVRREG